MNRIQKNSPAVWTLLAGVLFTHLASYLVQPYLSLYLSQRIGFSLQTAGEILAAASIFYVAFSFIGGILSDRIGRKWGTFIGLFIRGIGLLLYAVSPGKQAEWFYAAAVLSGIGNGIYVPAAKSGIAVYSSSNDRQYVFSLRGIAANIGTTLGPVIGGFLFSRSTFILFAVACLIYEMLSVFHVLIVPKESPDSSKRDWSHSPNTISTFKEITKDKSYLYFTLISILIWMLYTQLSFSVPIRMTVLHLPKPAIGYVWAVSSIVIIALQAKVTQKTEKFHPLHLLFYGMLLLAIGFGSVSLSTGFWSLLASVLIITFGEMLIMPTVDSTVALFANDANSGVYYGIASVAYGAGEALGNIGGGFVMNLAEQAKAPLIPWIVYGLTGIVIAGLIFLTKKNKKMAVRISH